MLSKQYIFIFPKILKKLIRGEVCVCLHDTDEHFTSLVLLLISLFCGPLKCNFEEVILDMLSMKGLLKYFISELGQKQACLLKKKKKKAHKEACLGKVFFKTADISFREPLFQFTELIVLISELSSCSLNFFSKSFNDF